ncbi:hypothetical protein [Neisseria elongata]|uniref:hypothetical protein n=1 Tax=Neisseria elongata TaxID=495 RepID=UPI001581DDED|nr:hypothetical protein [Neisseria elongata]
MSDKQYGHFVHGFSQFVLMPMILRETFARTIPFGEEHIFSIRNNWSLLNFYVLFLLFKGYLKVWMIVWLAYKKQPALCFSNVQAAFAFTPMAKLRLGKGS